MPYDQGATFGTLNTYKPKPKPKPTYTAPKSTTPTYKTPKTPTATAPNWKKVEDTPTVIEQSAPDWLGSGMQSTGGGTSDPATDYYSDQLAAQEEAARIRKQAALDANNAYIPQVNQYADKRLQESYIAKEMARVNTPQQLSAAGINGGAAETTLLGLETNYQNNRNSIDEDRGNTLNQIQQNAQQIEATGNADLADVAANYYQNLIAKQQRDAETQQSNYRWQTEFDADRADTAYSNKLAMAQYLAELGDYSGLQELGINVNALNDQDGSTGRTIKSNTVTPTVPETNYYSDTDRRLSQLSIPSSQTALIRQLNTEGKLTDVQAEALLKKYGLVW